MADWITNTIDSLGYLGVALLMVLENIIPPIPSELVMPAAGFAARQGDGSAWAYVVAGTIGSLLGTVPYYFLARWLGAERLGRFAEKYGKWIGIGVDEVDRSVRWFERWGTIAVVVGRLVPGLRTVISVPAGLANMNFGKFLACTVAGTIAWNAILTGLGWYLQSRYHAIKPYTTWIGVAVVTMAVAWLAWRVYKSRFQSNNHQHSSAAES